MTEQIKSDASLLLMEILGDIQNRTYIQLVKDVENNLKQGISKGEVPEGEAPITHHFAPKVYMRQMDAKAGTLVVSKMHRTEHLNILLRGSVTIVTENGLEFLKAPLILKSSAGTKRIGYFNEDSSWITVHPTDLTCVDEIENEVIVSEHEVDDFLKAIGRENKEFVLCHGEQ